jgi:hypothetical protein
MPDTTETVEDQRTISAAVYAMRDAGDRRGVELTCSDLEEMLRAALPYLTIVTDDTETTALRSEANRLQAILCDLRDRTVRADAELQRLAPKGAAPEYRRLTAKAEGVRLALSYLDEAIKDAGERKP